LLLQNVPLVFKKAEDSLLMDATLAVAKTINQEVAPKCIAPVAANPAWCTGWILAIHAFAQMSAP